MPFGDFDPDEEVARTGDCLRSAVSTGSDGGTDSDCDEREPEDLVFIGMEHAANADSMRSHARVAHLVASSAVTKLMHVAGVGWYAWNRRYWERDVDEKLSKATVMETVRRFSVEAPRDNELLADLRQAQTASGVRGVLELMAALRGIRATVDELDADPYILNVANGTLRLNELQSSLGAGSVLDLHSLTLYPHNPAHKITRITRAKFDPDASSAEWEAFLAKSLPEPDVRAYLQRAMGVALIGEQVEHLLPILRGEGRNGKGVYYEVQHHALGSYSHVAPSSLFELTKGDPNKPNPAMLDLRGARVAWLSETDKGARFDPALMKRLTGGDPITGRYLYQSHSITFTPSHLAVLITNHPPQLPADDPAVWARTRVCPFDVVVPKDEQDPHLKRKLKKRSSANAILAWNLRGLAEYEAEGLGEPAGVEEATHKYMDKQDTVSRFVEAMCTDVSPGQGSTVSDLHESYREWCAAEAVMREHRLGLHAFGARLDVLGYPSAKGTGGRRYRDGLALDGRGAVVISIPTHAAATTSAATPGPAAAQGLDSWALPEEGVANAA